MSENVKTPAQRASVSDAHRPVIELRDVEMRYRARNSTLFNKQYVDALAGVSLQVMPGRTLGIVGESGSGKSTSAKVLLGLEQPTAGQVVFDGEVVTKFTTPVRRRIGRIISAVFQDPATALNARMTVREALIDPMQVHGLGSPRDRERKTRDLLTHVGLPQSALEAMPGQLSGGQRQRVAIARALALDPQVIVADEPTSALDVSVRAQILNLLTDLKDELGLAMVFISHDIQTVRYLSDEIAVMNRGRVVEYGPAAEVFDNPSDDYTRTLLGAAPSLLELH
ncbi:ABC transporter ATP-binding protein [Leucobacter sp. HY1908]